MDLRQELIAALAAYEVEGAGVERVLQLLQKAVRREKDRCKGVVEYQAAELTWADDGKAKQVCLLIAQGIEGAPEG